MLSEYLLHSMDFFARLLDDISRGNQWRRREMSLAFSGYRTGSDSLSTSSAKRFSKETGDV